MIKVFILIFIKLGKTIMPHSRRYVCFTQIFKNSYHFHIDKFSQNQKFHYSPTKLATLLDRGDPFVQRIHRFEQLVLNPFKLAHFTRLVDTLALHVLHIGQRGETARVV